MLSVPNPDEKRTDMKHGKRICALLLAAAAALSLCGCRKTKQTDQMTLGIDVARYQGTIDWQEVAGSDVDFAMVRLGYRSMSQGDIVADCNARYNLQEATKAGIPVGAYFFSTAITKQEAVEEAKWAASILRDYPITYPVAYDCEGFTDPDSRHHGLSRQERTDIALAFLRTIEALGYEGMFYGSKNDLQGGTHWDTERIAKKYKIWVAQYPLEPYPATPQSSYEGAHQMWQYTMSGSVPGIDQPVDQNVAYFGYDGIEPAKAKEPPAQVEPDVEALMNFTQVEEMVTAKEETNLRNMPNLGQDSQVIYTLMNGETAKRVAVSADGWSKLIFNGQTVYALTNYLKPVEETPPAAGEIQTQFTPVSDTVTAKVEVNLRSLPSVEREDSVILGQLKNGTYLPRTGISDNGWSQLTYEGQTVYAVSSYLTTEPDAQQTTQPAQQPQEQPQIQTQFEDINDQVTAKVEVNLRTLPSVEREDSIVVAKLKNGEIVQRTGINKDVGWSRVVYNGQTLYCVSQYLTAP